jgi:hypothetical protein
MKEEREGRAGRGVRVITRADEAESDEEGEQGLGTLSARAFLGLCACASLLRKWHDG